MRRRCKSRVCPQFTESLERRRLLSGLLGPVPASVTNTLDGIDATMANISDSLFVLPVVGQSAKEVDKIRYAFREFSQPLRDALNVVDNLPTFVVNTVRNTIGDALRGIGILGDTDGNHVVNNSDVSVVFTDLSNFSIAFDLEKQFDVPIPSERLSLGLGSIPIGLRASSGANLNLTFAYDNFRFGRSSGSFFFDTSTSRELSFTLGARLPQTMTVMLGIIAGTATNNTVGDNFTGTISADLNGLNVQSPRLGGVANFNLGIEAAGAGATQELLPKLKTDLELSWPFGNLGASGPENAGADLLGSYGQFGTPALAFNNLSIGLGSLMSDVIKPIANMLSSITRPLQDAMDMLYSPIPGISDMSTTFGGPRISIAEIAAFNGLFPPGSQPLPTEFDNFVRLTTKLRDFSKLVNDLTSSVSVADAYIPLGNFPISGPSAGSLLVNQFGQKLGNLLGGAINLDWSELVALGQDLTFEQVVDRAVDAVGGALGNDVADMLRQLQNNLGLSEPDGVYFSYPIIKDTKNQLLGALLGKDVEFVQMTARWKNQQFGDLFKIPIVYGVAALIPLEARPDAEIRVGLDSAGLKQAISAAVNTPGLDPLTALAIHAPKSVYVMSDARFNVTGTAGLGVGLNAPGFSVGPTVGFNADVSVQLDIPNPSTIRKIRVFDPAGELGSSLFRVSGNVRAYAGLTTEVGINPLKVTKTWNWAEKTLFSFDTYPNGKVPNPFVAQVPPTLARFESPGVLTLLMGNSRASARGIAVNDINERFTVTQWADGANQRVITVNAYGLEQDFLGVDVIDVFGEDGNDVVAFDKTVTVPVAINLGSGNDQLNFGGTGYLTVVAGEGDDKLSLASRGASMDVYGQNGNDDISVSYGGNNTTRYVFIDGGADDDNIAINSTFRSNQSVSVVGGSGSDQISAAAISRSLLAGYPNPQALTLNGGPNNLSDTDSVVLRTTPDSQPQFGGGWVEFPENDTYLITDATIRRQTPGASFDINYSNIQRIQVIMSGGNDQATVTASNRDVWLNMGDGNDRFIASGTNNTYRVFGEAGDDLFNLWGGVVNRTSGHSQLLGGPGIDSIEYDVSFSSSSVWQISNGSVLLNVDNGPNVAPQNGSIQSDGWEGVRFTGTPGVDTVAVIDSIPFNLYINTQGGDDLVQLINARNPFQVFVNNNIGLDLGGQTGDTLTAYTTGNQNRFVLNASGYNASRDGDLALINSLRVGPVAGVGLFNLLTDTPDDVIDIDASGNPFRRYNIDGLSGNDQITFRNFGEVVVDSTINGGAGVDTITFDDSARTTGLRYVVSSNSMFVPLAEFFGAFHAMLGFEQVFVKTGSGNDDVQVTNFVSGGTLSIETGAGNDVVSNALLFNASGPPFYWGDWQNAFASIGSFNWDGGLGTDRFGIDNAANGGNWNWYLQPDRITAQRPSAGYFATLFHSNTEGYSFLGGPGADVVHVPATDVGDILTLNAGPGDDTYNAFDTFSRRTDSIRSLITITDTSGNDTLRADNAGKPDTGGLGDWIHITEGVLSHTTNDRFFAPGGRVVHSGIDLLRVQTSQAVDYAVVTPSPNYVIDVYDSNIVNTPGDNIYFSLAGVDNPQYVDLFTTWRLTSTNRMNVNVSGFEFPTLGSEVPVVTQAPAPVFDGPAFYLNVAFSVPMDIFTFGSGEAFTVENLTTGQTLSHGSMLATDSGVNGFFITFPGHENGLPPDGRYRITLNGDYVRSVNYNSMGADQSFGFNILRGDADNDGLVGFSDLLILAQNYGLTGRPFSQGNFDYSAGGTVDFSDLLLLAQRYGTALPPLVMTRPRVAKASRGTIDVLS